MALPLQLTLFELRTLLGGELEAWGNPPAQLLERLVPYEKGEWGDLVVLPEKASPMRVAACRSGFVVGCAAQMADWARGRQKMNEPGWFLRVDNAARALSKLLEGPCRPPELDDSWLEEKEIVSRWGAQAATAAVHRSASIGEGTWIGPGAVVHARVGVGRNCRIGEHVVLGAPGFGFVQFDGRSVHLPHWAGVHIDNDVWIGPQSQVSAGLLEPTTIGPGCRIDALVQIGHNSRLGAHCLIAGQSGVAGSVELGDGCVVGGQAGISDHVRLGPGCRIAARAGVTKSWPAGSVLRGFPARPDIPRTR